MKKRFKLIFGCLFFALMFIHLWASIYVDWQNKTRYSLLGWDAMTSEGTDVIFRIDRGGPESELMVGDEIVALESHQNGAVTFLGSVCHVPPGTIYSLVIRRGGETKEFTLKTIPFPLYQWISDWLSNLILLGFLLTGLAVLLLKPGDPRGWLLALMLGTVVGLLRGAVDGVSGWMLVATAVARTVGLAFFPIFFHFFLIFPERGPALKRFPRLEFLLYAPFVLTILPVTGLLRIAGILDLEQLANQVPAKNLLRLGSMISII